MLRSIAFALALGAAGAASASEVTNCSRAETGGMRTLCHAMVLPASAEQIWPLFATSEGLNSWVAPVAAIDLRIGGIWETSYEASARLGDPGNIRNRVLSFLPNRMLSIAIDQAPAGSPELERARTLWTVIELEPIDAAHTRVRVSMTGYGGGDGFDELYAFFDHGNTVTLEALAQRIANGPADWTRP